MIFVKIMSYSKTIYNRILQQVTSANSVMPHFYGFKIKNLKIKKNMIYKVSELFVASGIQKLKDH